MIKFVFGPMDQQTRIRKIMAGSNCSYDQALQADSESNGNINTAIDLAKQKANELYVGGGSSGLAVESRPQKNEIRGYRNGLLVNNKFYDYSENNNIRLKKMLENNEFDAEVLGVDDSRAEVTYKNCESEDYKDDSHPECCSKTKSYKDLKQHTLTFDSPINLECPDEIIMDKDGDVKFKILVDGRRILVIMNENMKVADFYKELRKYTNKNVFLIKGDRKILPTDEISVLRRNMFMLREEK